MSSDDRRRVGAASPGRVAGAVACAMIAGAVLAPAAARAETPLDYWWTHGSRAQSISHLLWFSTAVSILVIVIVSALLLGGIFRRRSLPAPDLPGQAAVARPHGGASWITIGVGITTVVLVFTTVWTFATLAHTGPQPGPAAVRLQITAHQWWWEVRYLSDKPSEEFTTANEIHIPVGQIVEVKLRGPDVIHSFWVPKLAGKTDVIPGQENQTWLQADREGVYRGQCGEYCGQQHAHMAFEVIASPPDAYAQWRQQQLQPAHATDATEPQSGEGLFTTRCGICHTVRGSRAGGILGPDLTHVMSRRTIAADTLPNTTGNLAAWIADPQHIKPGNRMPRLALSGEQLTLIRHYVETLK
ncbi:cytochrome c oxidase subunit II [Bradyrhizobium sp. ORS 375]|uniref:cytochrome c oxidase subunit II n=1 Tax=Bradyrhizobium sp. (strain ORS 375) TaxID=566679 RepID=UPI0007E8E193|nr:cytochrome c oxidase subunit II [Bradyrhizobium sp. ORS 375]